MKKIFRMALVFALAGATLMYTGCSKDYGEDIDKLDSKLSSVQSDLSAKLSDLEGQLSNLKSTVSALDAAYKAADDAIKSDINGIKSDISGLKTRVAAIEDAIKDLDKLATKEELKEAKEALEAKIAADIEAAKAELLAKAENLQNQINEINAALALKANAADVYTKDEIAEILAAYYTKVEIDEFLATKADKDAVFTKEEVTAFLAEKADKNTVYTKEEIDDMFANYFTKEQINEMLDKKADKDNVFTKAEIEEMFSKYFTKEQINDILEGYYTKEEIAGLLADYYTKDEADDKFYTKAEVNDLLSKYYTAEEVDGLLAGKADKDSVFTKSEIAALLAGYYTKDEMDAKLSQYYTKDEVDAKLADYYKKTEIDAFLDSYYTKDEIDEKVNAMQDAQDKLNDVFALLSDELRSIVFLPDFYLGGIEATSYDFAHFYGMEPVALAEEYEDTYELPDVNGDIQDTKVVFPVGAKTEYRYTYLRDEKDNLLLFKYNSQKEEFVTDKDGNLVPDKNGRPYPYADFTQGQVGMAVYDLNPSTFPVDSADWTMNGREAEYKVKSTDKVLWSPIVHSVVKNELGQAEVNFSIENAAAMWSHIYPAFYDYDVQLSRPVAVQLVDNFVSVSNSQARKANVAILQLVATLKGSGRVINSDWHAVTSDMECVSHLAFSSKNKYVTDPDYNWDCGSIQDPFTFATLYKDLYYDAYDPVEPDASVPVKFNGGPVDLEPLISIHTWHSGDYEYKEYSLAEFNKKYPEFEYKFELVPYTIGDENTSEDMYGDIDGTMFTPCYVESKNGKPISHKIEKDSEDELGVSSVGRMPIVLVTLVNKETGYTYVPGWFKIEIVKDDREPQTRIFEIPDLGKVPFICGDFTLRSKWHEFSFFVLENLKVTYKEFLNTYTLTGIYGMEKVLDGFQIVPKMTELVAIDGDMDEPVELYYDEPVVKNNSLTFEERYYGTAAYYKDNAGTGINDAFEWNVGPQDIGEGNSKSIYFRFENGKYDIVYIEMKADVAGHAKFDFGKNKIANEWFDDINNETKNTARINVLVPNQDGDDVTEFYRDLNRFFIGYKPKTALTADSDPVYSNYFDEEADTTIYKPSELEADFTFYFDAEQPKIVFTDKTGNPIKLTDVLADGETTIELSEAQLYVNTWGNSDTLYVAQFEADGDKVVRVDTTIDNVKYAKMVEDHVIATLDTNGVVTYYYDTTDVMSKKLLNLWSYTQTAQERMLYANVLVKTTYGECEIPAGDEKFHLRFVRPLDVNFKGKDVAQESAVNGFNVLIADFISGIVDWNKQNVIVPEKDSKGKLTGYYVENIIGGVHMYQYYGFKNLILDLEGAMRDNWNVDNLAEKDLLTNVTPEAQLQLGTVETKKVDGVETTVFTPGSSNVLDISDLANLKGAALNYRNDRAVVETFNLFIPVTIEYSWGTMTEVLEIRVKKTADTDAH